ncbi:MAG: EAL domain-containing protein, partial [Chloroflexota bacterium]
MEAKLSQFVAIRSPNEPLKEFSLVPGINTIGRHLDCEITVSDDAASRYHTEVVYDANTNSIIVTDLNSTNGTFINGKKLSKSKDIEANDVLRIGRILLTFLPLQVKSPKKNELDFTKSIVTGELVMESIDSYAVLLHDVGLQLINVPELPVALDKISGLLQDLIGSENCSIFLLNDTEQINAAEIPTSVYEELTESNTARIFSSHRIDSDSESNEIRGDRLVAPVQIDEKAVAIISANKSASAEFPFNPSDLKVVIAVSHQVALAIQRNQLETQLLHTASHDALTGLPNRGVFIDRLSQAINFSKRSADYAFAVLFLDVDDFKVVNDTLGHEVGDKVLVELSQRLNDKLRITDTLTHLGSIARFGGDEFAILLSGFEDKTDPLFIARRICKIATNPFVIDGHNINISLSVGLTSNNLDYRSPDDMLRDADIAMYRAKDSGKNRVEFYDREFHIDLMEKLKRQQTLRIAVEQKEFKIHYQPIISVTTNKIVGHEALVRWYTPDGKVVSPNDFIPLLESASLLVSIDHWVLMEACNQTMLWREKFTSHAPLTISVNFSTKNFSDSEVVKFVANTLEATKLPPSSLWLEITESVGLDISDVALESLNQLRSMGVKICIDDFGTGYSALNYLIDLPVNSLKIDTSIIRRLDTFDKSRKITSAVASLAKQLELEIVAEGIETKNQFDIVKELGCDYAQG